MTQITWGKNWIGPYEGQVTVLWKLAWANQWTWRQLREQVQMGQSHPRWLRRAYSPLHSELVHIRRQENDERFTWTQLLPDYQNGVEKLFDDAPRFCDECLRLGYHSYFHQFLPLAQCPIHARLLRRCCCCCEGRVLSFIEVPEYSCTPFHCGHCDHPLAGQFDWRLLYQQQGFKQSARTAFTPLECFLEAVSRSPFAANIRADAPFLPQVEVGEGTEQSDQAIKFFHALLDLVAAKFDLTPFFARPAQIRSVSYEKTKLQFPVDPQGGWNREQLARYKAVYKSIRRHLRKRLHCHCRACLRVISEKIVTYTALKQTVYLRHDLCPLAQAYFAWSLRLGSSKAEPSDYLAYELKDRVPFRWGGSYRQIATRYDDLHMFAWQTLSSFHAVAVTVARYFEEVRAIADDGNHSVPLAPLLRYLMADAPAFHTECSDISRGAPGSGGTHGVLAVSDAAVKVLERMTRSSVRRSCSFNQRYVAGSKRDFGEMHRCWAKQGELFDPTVSKSRLTVATQTGNLDEELTGPSASRSRFFSREELDGLYPGSAKSRLLLSADRTRFKLIAERYDH